MKQLREVELRKKYRAWSKYKIGAMIRKEGIDVSDSTIGRVLKRRSLIDLKISRKKRRSAFKAES
ncbi:MAG: hypothetical protein WA091_01860 [Minisyncoccales bacterium]